MVATARAVTFVRVIAIVSALPLVLSSIAALWPLPSHGPVPYLDQGWMRSIVIAVAIALYVLFWLRIWPARRWGWIAVVLAGMATMTALDLAISEPPPPDQLALYVAIVAGASLPPRWAGLVVLLMVAMSEVDIFRPLSNLPPLPNPINTSTSGSVLGPSAGLLDYLRLSLTSVGSSVAGLLTGALSGMLVTFLVRTTAELYAARSGLAQLVVEEERTRLARDLHDVLGHNLLLIAVKLELAGRLIGDRDRNGAAEVREAQRMARDALRDVREVVSGYRQPTLEGELAGAAMALEAAGVTMELSDHRGVLSTTLEATCAWLVREGVTNVIKHSGARTCEIAFQREDDRLTVRIADDGTGGKVNGAGMGLQGLSERVTAVGGTLLAGSTVGARGFQLVAQLPVDGERLRDQRPKPEDGL
jgi:signal transduction histidine kinase